MNAAKTIIIDRILYPHTFIVISVIPAPTSEYVLPASPTVINVCEDKFSAFMKVNAAINIIIILALFSNCFFIIEFLRVSDSTPAVN